MSLRLKLVSAITAMILMLGVMLTGILAAQQQTLTMTGNVNFNIGDKSLYVKQVRIKQDNNSDPQVVSDFLPGYINGEFNMNIGEFTGINSNTLGSFALYFDIINATDIQWAISNVEVAVPNVSVSYSGVIEVNELTDTDSDGFKNFDPATKEADGTLILVITAPNTGILDLSSITITLDEYVEETIYERVDAEGNPDENGDYILFGYYPQSAIESSVEIVDTGTQDSRGYYLGSDGEYYAQAEDGNYYKVERLRWRILDDTYGDGTALIVCDVIVDQVAYQSNYTQSGNYYYATDGSNILIDNEATVGEGVDSSHQVYANNYKHSELREYLTGTFYDTAFNDNEKASIVLTEVDNSLASTGGQGGQYVCENTNDYVFALSVADVTNTDYGFSSSQTGDSKKAFMVTDYAEANGAYVYSTSGYEGAGAGWLRSPSDDRNGRRAFDVVDGYYGDGNVDRDFYGAVPALQIQLS